LNGIALTAASQATLSRCGLIEINASACKFADACVAARACVARPPEVALQQALEHSHTRQAIKERLARGPHINYLRDWIYGGIDGAVTTFAIVAGVAGAILQPLWSWSSALPIFSPTDDGVGFGVLAPTVVVGTGGLSHQLDGTRAGFINKDFDALCLDKIVAEPEALARMSIHDLVQQSGTQGVEFLNWMAMRGAMTGEVTEANRNYHIPISNTAAATVVYDNKTAPRRMAA
jgi:hypothetical protein